jgi:Mrp family chromosome partitioning ATPase
MSAKQVILVLSGKGGVGKSTVSACLALSLARGGYQVGLLDIDLCGPSISKILGLSSGQSANEGRLKVVQGEKGWVPVRPAGLENLAVMSMAFLLENPNDSIVWRGPKKTAMIQQFLFQVDWGCLDYLIIDTPPGTSDEHISIVEKLSSSPFSNPRALIVTTPQWVSISDVLKEISFCRTVGLEITGLIENMSGVICPECSECSYIFSRGGGRALSVEQNIPFMAALPLDVHLVQNIENHGLLNTPDQSNATLSLFTTEIIPKIIANVPKE